MPGHSATSSQDSRNLDQLINGINHEDSADGDDTEHELPLLVPLSHDHPLLSSETETFNVDAFLLSRPNTSLSDLRVEMRDYLAQLKEELVQLINDDYAAFISLRTDLRGEGPRLEHLQGPLELVKQEIDVRGRLVICLLPPLNFPDRNLGGVCSASSQQFRRNLPNVQCSERRK
jgi:hypothetical protein